MFYWNNDFYKNNFAFYKRRSCKLVYITMNDSNLSCFNQILFFPYNHNMQQLWHHISCSLIWSSIVALSRWLHVFFVYVMLTTWRKPVNSWGLICSFLMKSFLLNILLPISFNFILLILIFLATLFMSIPLHQGPITEHLLNTFKYL